jgi:hypothetical protein
MPFQIYLNGDKHTKRSIILNFGSERGREGVLMGKLGGEHASLSRRIFAAGVKRRGIRPYKSLTLSYTIR